MELKNQVVSLELAKKLKELGFKQDSLWYWEKNAKWMKKDGYKLSYDLKGDTVLRVQKGGIANKKDIVAFSAYTVAELGEILYNTFEKNGWILIYKAYGEVFNFKGTHWIGEIGIINLMRTPDMGAKILIYLKENNLI